MVNMSIDEIRTMMESPQNVRNIALIAQEDHGRRSLLDLLISRAGIFESSMSEPCSSEERQKEFMHREISVQTLYYSDDYREASKDKKGDYLIALLCKSGQLNENVELLSALRIIDGVIIAIDIADGFSSTFQLMLRLSIRERVKPTLMLNKLDFSLSDSHYDGEKFYQHFKTIIQKTNEAINLYQLNDMGFIQLDPAKGNVTFGSGKQGWAFSIETFANIYSSKFKISYEKMTEKLWGENYFDKNKMQWNTIEKLEDGRQLKHSFVQFILDPICKFYQCILQGKTDSYSKMAGILNIQLDHGERQLSGKQLAEAMMRKWLPAADCLLKMVVCCLPNPIEAQQYKTNYLYSSPINDDISESMRKCNPQGPLMIFISMMVPSRANNSRFYAFGRVFSGTVRASDKVRIMGQNYKHGKDEDLYEKSIPKTAYFNGQDVSPITDIPCGNLVLLVGIDKYLTGQGSITNIHLPQAYPIRTVRLKTDHAIKMLSKPQYFNDLPRNEGFQRKTKSLQSREFAQTRRNRIISNIWNQLDPVEYQTNSEFKIQHQYPSRKDDF